MKSLLLLGFPRGFTDQTHHIVSEMVPALQAPIMYDGEVLHGGELLNSDRSVGLTQDFDFFLRPQHPDFERAYKVFAQRLSQYTRDHLLKDVVQPYAVLRYLVENPAAYQVVFVDRPIGHVLQAQWKRCWTYMESPRRLRPEMLRFPTFEVSRALYDEAYTHAFFAALYPDASFVNYIDEAFARRRDNFAAAYREPVWINNFRHIREFESFAFEGFADFETELGGQWSLAAEAAIVVGVVDPLPAGASIELRVQLPGCFVRPSRVRFSTCRTTTVELELQPKEIALVEIPFGAEDCEHGVLRISMQNQHQYIAGSNPRMAETRPLGAGITGIAAFQTSAAVHPSGDTVAAQSMPGWRRVLRL